MPVMSWGFCFTPAMSSSTQLTSRTPWRAMHNLLSLPWSRSKGGQTRNEQISWNLMSHCGLVMAFKRLLEVDLAGLMSKLEQFFWKCVCLCTWRLEDDVVRCHTLSLSHLSTLFPWGGILTELGAHGVLSSLVAGKLQQCSCFHFSPASQSWDYRHCSALPDFLYEFCGFDLRALCFQGKLDLPTEPSLSPSNVGFSEYWNFCCIHYNYVCGTEYLECTAKCKEEKLAVMKIWLKPQAPFRGSGKVSMASAVCRAEGVSPVLLASSAFCVVSQALLIFLSCLSVIVPVGCLHRSSEILLRCPEEKYCLLFSWTKWAVN